MDGNDSMNLRNWGFLEPPRTTIKNHLGLQLMSSMAEKPPFDGNVPNHHHNPPSSIMPSVNGGSFHHHRVGGISEPQIPIEYWMNNNRDKYLNAVSLSHQNLYYQPNYAVPSETSSAHSMQMPQQINLLKNENVILQMEEACKDRDNVNGGGVKKRGGGKIPKSPPKDKKPRTRAPRVPRDEATPPVHRARAPKKRAEVVINGINMDISGIPIPVCSCTGTLQQCYRWGSGGWQSACCTTGLSMYPLPMSTKRRGARIAGRKMSIGAFKKVLEKLASEGYNFSDPIDLRHYWAKHGTNKFVTIR